MPCLSNAQSSTLQPTKNADIRFLRYVTVFVSLRSHLPTLETERFEND